MPSKAADVTGAVWSSRRPHDYFDLRGDFPLRQDRAHASTTDSRLYVG